MKNPKLFYLNRITKIISLNTAKLKTRKKQIIMYIIDYMKIDIPQIIYKVNQIKTILLILSQRIL